MLSELCVEVAQEHTDELGHLNHVQALDFLQSGRLEFYRLCGLRPGQGGDRFGTVIVNLNVNFRKECFLGQSIKIQTRPVSIGKKSFVVAQDIVLPDGQIAIDGVATSVVMDMTSREIIVVPALLAEYFPAGSD